jgi:hypothetical protein
MILALIYHKQYIECVAFFHSPAIAIGSSLLRLLLCQTHGLLSNKLSRLALNEEVPRRGFFVMKGSCIWHVTTAPDTSWPIIVLILAINLINHLYSITSSFLSRSLYPISSKTKSVNIWIASNTSGLMPCVNGWMLRCRLEMYWAIPAVGSLLISSQHSHCCLGI